MFFGRDGSWGWFSWFSWLLVHPWPGQCGAELCGAMPEAQLCCSLLCFPSWLLWCPHAGFPPVQVTSHGCKVGAGQVCPVLCWESAPVPWGALPGCSLLAHTACRYFWAFHNWGSANRKAGCERTVPVSVCVSREPWCGGDGFLCLWEPCSSWFQSHRNLASCTSISWERAAACPAGCCLGMPF